MTTEETLDKAEALAQRMYNCGDAREFCGRSAKSIKTEARVLATALGDAEVYGVVSRHVDGREPHEASGFVFFTSVGVWTLELARNGRRDDDMNPAIERVSPLKLIPFSRIQSLSVASFDSWGVLREDINPEFVVEIEGVGDVIVNDRTSRDGRMDGPASGQLFAHLRGILADRQ